MHKDDGTTSESLCDAVVSLAGHELNRSKLGGACSIVAHILSKHYTTSATLTNLACIAIHLLSMDEENRHLIAGAGGCEAIVNVLTFHIANQKVVENACRAIASISKVSYIIYVH